MGTVLVTGAGGYIGGRLVRALPAGGRSVHALVREAVPWLDAGQTECDLCTIDPGDLARVCSGAEAVVHLAGENEVLAACDPAAALSGTVVATERVARACRAAGVPRLVYLSTVHVYGARMAPGAMLAEDLRPEPRGAYATSRLACEHVAASYVGDGCELVILRLTNAVGAPADPRVDRWSPVANDLARQGALSGRLTLRSSGAQWRDFVSVRDVCGVIAAACTPGRLAPGTYNVASGPPATVRQLAGLIQDAFEQRTGRRPPLATAEPPPDAPPGPYRVLTERLAAAGLRPATPLAEAVSETVAFCLSHREELA